MGSERGEMKEGATNTDERRGAEQKRRGTSNAREEVIGTKQTARKKWRLTFFITLPVIGHNYGWRSELLRQRLSTPRQMMAGLKETMKAIHGHYQPRDGSSIAQCTALSNTALDFS